MRKIDRSEFGELPLVAVPLTINCTSIESILFAVPNTKPVAVVVVLIQNSMVDPARSVP
jgi:hypothetical protein